jgi:hypothetical protein
MDEAMNERRLMIRESGQEKWLDASGCSNRSAVRKFMLGPTALHQVMQLFGNGYGDKFFELIWGDEKFEGCTLDGSDGGVGYLKVGKGSA